MVVPFMKATGNYIKHEWWAFERRDFRYRDVAIKHTNVSCCYVDLYFLNFRIRCGFVNPGRSGRSLGRTPGMHWFPCRKIIEPNIGRGEHLGQQNNLPGVHGKMFGNVKDRSQR